MKVLIIEDEKRAANHLERLLLALDPKIEIIRKLESVREAIDFLNLQPNLTLIFADVQLADGLSFEIFKSAQIQCPIIFTTAFDQYAIRAFELNAVDYLLKPFSKERFDDALEKAVSRINKQEPEPDKIEKLVTAVSESEGHLTRIVFRKGAGIKIIPLNNVSHLAAADDYVMIYHTEGKELKRKTMK